MEKLSNEEIKKRIEELKAFIIEKSTQESFVLNEELYKAQQEILLLREKCPHKVVKNSICTVCGAVVYYDD